MDCGHLTTTVAPTVLATDECLKPILFSRRKGRVGGQTTVEFALVCLPFFAILFAIIDFAQIYFYENSLQNALRESCRFATAGRVIQAVDSNGNPLFETTNGITVPEAISDGHGEASRNECIRYWFLTNCVLKNFPLSNIDIVSAPALPGVQPVVETNSITGYLTLLQTNGATAIKGPGNASDYIQITATYQLNTITPFISFLGGWGRPNWGSSTPVHVSAIVKNEPALLNFLHAAIYTNEP